MDDEINENEDIILAECPNCHSRNLIELDSEVTKDELDYQIKKRNYFKEYKCSKCNKIVKKNILLKLKEDKSIWLAMFKQLL